MAVDRQPAADTRKHGNRLAGGLAQGSGRRQHAHYTHDPHDQHALQRAHMPSWRLGVAAHPADGGAAQGKQGKQGERVKQPATCQARRRRSPPPAQSPS